MAGVRTLSVFNFLIVVLNFLWIAAIENGFIYGYSFSKTFSQYPTYLNPAIFTYKIWTVISILIIVTTYLMYYGTQRVHYNLNTSHKIKKIDYLLILNQLALGLSMVLKHNDLFIGSIICTIICLVTMLIINNRIKIHRISLNSFTRYFIRLGFGVYTGWLMFVLSFNFATLLVKLNLMQNEQLFYYGNIAIILIISIAMLSYSYIKYLPSISIVLVWGIYGIYHQLQFSELPATNLVGKILIMIMIIGGFFAVYIFYRCNNRRTSHSLT